MFNKYTIMKKAILIITILLISFSEKSNAQILNDGWGLGIDLSSSYQHTFEMSGNAILGPLYLGIGFGLDKNIGVNGKYYSTISYQEARNTSHWQYLSDGERQGFLLYANIGLKLKKFVTFGMTIGSCQTTLYANFYTSTGILGDNGYFNVYKGYKSETYIGGFLILGYPFEIGNGSGAVEPYTKFQYTNIGGFDVKLGINIFIER